MTRPTGDDGRLARASDYAHRHFVNLAATAFLLVLAIVVIWTVRVMDQQESLRRCLGSGRKDCVAIQAPPKGMIQPVR